MAKNGKKKEIKKVEKKVIDTTKPGIVELSWGDPAVPDPTKD